MRGPRSWVVVATLVAVLVAIWWWMMPRTTTVSLYFLRPEQNATTLAPASRIVSARGAVLVEAVLRALLEGPNDAERARGLTSAIPPGTNLRGVEVRDGVVRADFSREVEAGGGSSSMLGRFYQIVYTATQFAWAPRVQILIEGHERTSMGGEGVLIDRPISRPPTVPKF